MRLGVGWDGMALCSQDLDKRRTTFLIYLRSRNIFLHRTTPSTRLHLIMVYLTTLSAAPIRSVEWYDDWRKMRGNGLVKNLPEIFLQGLRKTTRASGYLIIWPSFKPPTSKIQRTCAVPGYYAASSGNLLPRIHVICIKLLANLLAPTFHIHSLIHLSALVFKTSWLTIIERTLRKLNPH